MATEKKPEYLLTQGLVDSVRLNVGHMLWKKEFPWTFHPSIQLKDRKNLRIADVGCGTGIWILEASEEYPEAERIDGLDITIHQAPPKHLLPENVHFKVLNAVEDIPDEFLEQYDVINARFVLALVQNEDPVPLLKRLMSMLKPGGYLQWSEVEWGSDVYIGLEENGITKEESGIHRMRVAGRRMIGAADGALTWPTKLSEILQANGMDNVKMERTSLELGNFPRMYGRYWSETIVAPMVDMMHNLPDGEKKDMFVKMAGECNKDVKKGIVWAGDHFVVVGQRPM